MDHNTKTLLGASISDVRGYPTCQNQTQKESNKASICVLPWSVLLFWSLWVMKWNDVVVVLVVPYQFFITETVLTWEEFQQEGWHHNAKQEPVREREEEQRETRAFYLLNKHNIPHNLFNHWIPCLIQLWRGIQCRFISNHCISRDIIQAGFTKRCIRTQRQNGPYMEIHYISIKRHQLEA